MAADDGFAITGASLLIAVFGVVLGFEAGNGVGETIPDSKTFWKDNAIAYVLGIVVSAFIWAAGWVVLSFGTIGALGGAIAGLRMGYGQSTGPWASLDRFLQRRKSKAAPQGAEKPTPSRPGGSSSSAPASQGAAAAAHPKPKKVAAAGTGWAKRKPEDEPESDEPQLISVADPGRQADRRGKSS